MLRTGLYARVSTNDQQTLAMQNRAMREYVARWGWTVVMLVREIGSEFILPTITGKSRRPASAKR
jgi:DNA invertase Pin-like site-specific DNA recombinase